MELAELLAARRARVVRPAALVAVAVVLRAVAVEGEQLLPGGEVPFVTPDFIVISPLLIYPLSPPIPPQRHLPGARQRGARVPVGAPLRRRPERPRVVVGRLAAQARRDRAVEPPLDGATAADEAVDVADIGQGVPAFEKAHWESLQPATGCHARPQSARAASGRAPTGPRLGSSSSALFDQRPPLGSMSGVILASNAATPRRPRSDPVSMHAKRQAQWQSDSFLITTGGKKRAGRLIEPSSPPAPLQISRRRHNEYVVPTAKRRDDLVWQTRQRLQAKDSDANDVAARVGSGSKTMVPNFFVPATEKRRDDLRWAVRTETALMR